MGQAQLRARLSRAKHPLQLQLLRRPLLLRQLFQLKRRLLRQLFQLLLPQLFQLKRRLLLLLFPLPPPRADPVHSLVAGAIEKAVSPEKTQVEVPPVEAVAPTEPTGFEITQEVADEPVSPAPTSPMETSFTTQTLKEDLEASAKKAEKVQAETDEFAKIEAEIAKSSPPRRCPRRRPRRRRLPRSRRRPKRPRKPRPPPPPPTSPPPQTPKTLNPAGQNYDIAIDQSSSFNDPIQFPIAVRVVGKLGEVVAHVPPNSTAVEGFTKLKAKSEQVIGDVTQVRISVVGGPLSPLTPFHVDAVTVTHVAEDGESWTVNVGAQIDQFHGEVRAGIKASKEMPCEEWQEATVKDKKTGKSKMYWYSAERKSEWKEPAKYFPVKFKKAK